jgi:glycosyl-4,4'-diaponeurosporenoate acyltransferase
MVANLVFWFVLIIFGAAAITSLVPKGVYRPGNFLFRERPFEQRLYKAVKIGRWKDSLPIYRRNERTFDRKHLAKKISPEYLDAFITETCKAELVHSVLAIAGFSSVAFVFAGLEPWYTFLGIAVLMFCAHVPFILVQRYNRGRLLRLRSRM